FTGDDDYLEIYDAEHSYDEDRFIGIGPIQPGLVLVVYTERTEETIRIISARGATESEARLFRHYIGMIK
ncbi:MAG: BrnT family toxin, partial [Thermoanaerobaculales bacterium]|nr:BrnT family toxin [Thermoanaerobaculales bacterium]